MNRQEFMNELESLLSNIATEERAEALQYYEDYFEDAGVEKESEVIAELGSPAKVAKSIQMDMSQNNERGEFTERGYHSGDEINPFEVMASKNLEKDLDEDKSSVLINDAKVFENDQDESSDKNMNFHDNRNQKEEQFHHDNVRQDYNQNQNWNAQNQNWNSQNQNWNNQNQSWNNQNQNGNNQNQNWNNQTQNQSKNQNNNGYAGGYQQQAPYQGQNSRYQEPPRKKGLSAGAIILICIFAIPVGIPVLCALFGVFVGLGATVFGFIVGFGAAAFACILSGFLLFVIGILKVFVVPIIGMLLIGSGLLVFGIGLLFAVLTTACVKIIPPLFRGFINICKAPFRMGGVIA